MQHRLFLQPFARWAVVLLLLAAGPVIRGQAPLVEDLGYRGGSIPALKKPDSALHFIALGDWGRNGENYQKEVAAGMGKAAHDLDASFVVATGDNFYPYGVASTQDYHWISSFETIYTAQSLHVKWYPVLGNHDYASNPDAQVAYSQVSSRWSMPARYYSKTFLLHGDTVLFLFLDTDPIEKELRGDPYDSVKYKAGAVALQKEWLEGLLRSSGARWKIVVGHHPLYTGGWRKDRPDTENMRGFLEPLFTRYGVDVYLAGHEHHLEYIKPQGPTHHFISGAASEARPVQPYPGIGRYAAGVQGFATFSVSHRQVLVQFIDYKHRVIRREVILKN
ncbi:MAG TPA: metallophosphoesterase [Chitinophagaceae bacterium]|jgi:UDP-2,3-diacylglucosamine pyrophosphatase LpxH|nr:metallophosphoesterase [Chitinophagaceae bacterium]